MAKVGSLFVNVAANTGKFSSGMKRAGKDTRTFQKSVTMLKGAVGALGVGLSAGALFMGLKKTLSLAQQQIDAETKLASVLRSTGYAAGLGAEELGKFASQLQRVTNFGDEVTLNMMALVATFKNIKGDVFKETTRIIQDMATVMDMDLRSAAIQVGKAINDPITGLTMLTRVGITFTTEQKNMIRALQESGDLMGAQKVVMQELQSQFGGAAEAMVNPIVQLKNALGDVGETIGGELLPYIKLFATDAVDAFNRVGEAAETMQEKTAFQKFVGFGADVSHTLGMAKDMLGTSPFGGRDLSGKPMKSWMDILIEPTLSERAESKAMKRRSARPTAFGLHAARRQNSCNVATREATPAILAARASPSRW